MAYDSTKIIKKVAVGGVNYDVEALWFGGKSYEEIVNMISQARMHTKVDSKSSTKEEPATPASASTVGWIYLVALTGQKAGSYTEFITVESGTSTITYSWERIGVTDTDLSGYAKKGTYTSGGPSTDATSSAGAQTASGSATITYDKSDAATGSAGAGSSSNTGNAGAATVSVTDASFNGTAATLTQAAHKHSFSASASYTPAGSVTHAADSTATVLTGVKVTGSTAVIKSVSAGTAATKKGVKVSTSDAETGTVDVSYTKQALTGTTSFNTDAIKSASLGSTTTASTTSIKVIDSISSTPASASGTDTFVKDYPNFNGGSFSGATQASLTYETGAVTPSDTVYSITNVGTMSNASVADGVLTLTNGTTPTRSAAVTFTTTAHKITKWSANSVGTHTPASLGEASTASAVTGVTGGTAAAGTAKYLSVSTSAASKGTVTISDGAVSLTGTTTFAKSGLASAALAEDTATTPAFAFNTDAIKGVSSTTVSVATSVGADGTADAITAIGALGFSGTAATISMSGDTGNGGAVSIAYTPAGSVTGGKVTIAAHSHTYTAPSAHTHSIGSTPTTVTGTASVAVSNHTHSLSSHTHNVTI